MGGRGDGPKRLLVLADGTVFEGEAIGRAPAAVATGEVVFNTVLTGYQEVLTDPSYAGQVIAFTNPHIGNYGVTPLDSESRRPFCRGVVVRDLARRPSTGAAPATWTPGCSVTGVPGITGVDTRRLTRHIREAGSMPCAFGTADELTLSGRPTTSRAPTASTWSTRSPPRSSTGWATGRCRSSPTTSASRPASCGSCRRSPPSTSSPPRRPPTTSWPGDPDGVFLSNGPGDPAAVTYAIDAIGDLVGHVPVFGICLGHQLLASALGGTTYKLPFGHHGGNHPVKRLADGAVEITSQNHNYAVAEGSVGTADVTHLNLNDGVVEGLRCFDAAAFSVQYHPEAGPGPHDARYLFDDFRKLMVGQRLMPKRTDIESILLIGSGPIVIGQACEFDYSGTQACRRCGPRATG